MQVSPPTPPAAAHFAGFRLDLRAGELQDGTGKTARLPDQPFRILKTLLEHPGEVVTREELRKCLWPNDTIVEFAHSISAAMNRLRQALSDSAESRLPFHGPGPIRRAAALPSHTLWGRPVAREADRAKRLALPGPREAGRRRHGSGLQGSGQAAQSCRRPEISAS